MLAFNLLTSSWNSSSYSLTTNGSSQFCLSLVVDNNKQTNRAFTSLQACHFVMVAISENCHLSWWGELGKILHKTVGLAGLRIHRK